jgi:hypothetical protein
MLEGKLMSIKYTYKINNFPNQMVNPSRLAVEIRESTIITSLDYINSDVYDCDIYFKAQLSDPDWATLSGVVSVHTGEFLLEQDAPRTVDGKPIVRSDTRPTGTQTYFTMTGDDMQAGILGSGEEMRWDFSNSDNVYDPDDFENPIILASGVKAKYLEMKFTSPAYLKDGALFFFDAPWGAYASMYIVVPSGTYYPHPDGEITASALGLSGNTMYAYSTKKVFYASYLNKHFMYKDCARGVSMDAEGSQIDPVPSGWMIAGLVCCPEEDTLFKGFGLIEMYRTTIGLL